jgi:dextranase
VGFADLKTRYSTSEPVIVGDLPTGTKSVVCRTAFGRSHPAHFEADVAVASNLPVGTHALEAWSEDGELLCEEFTTVSRRPGDDPVIGFATSFDPQRVDEVLSWLCSLRCTIVQFYDWMQQYSAPLPSDGEYSDPLGRPLFRDSLERLVSGVRDLGAVAQAYAPICAAEPAYGEAHRDWLLYRNDGRPQHLGDLLEIMDPANTAWQEHWLAAYGDAADTLGFDGFHLDTYGYPRNPLDAGARPLSMRIAYRGFLERLSAALPSATLSFNQVNGVPSGLELGSLSSFRYVEVWPPNDRWRHLEGLINRSASPYRWAGGALALYPPVWGGDRDGALRTVMLTEAVTTSLGAGLLVFGDDAGVLCDPYYPNHARLRKCETSRVLDWHRFALRCRDLFRHGEDTSWCDLGDPNGAVLINTPDAAVSPEPDAGTLFARVVRTGSTTAISCIDLSGSARGSWAEPTADGKLHEARVQALVTDPGRCRAEVGVLGVAGGRFKEVDLTSVDHSEGKAVELRLPIAEGWSVARIDERLSPKAHRGRKSA